MFTDVSHFPCAVLAELHSSGLLFYSVNKDHPRSTAMSGLWNNSIWAYEERKRWRRDPIAFYIQLEE